MEEKIICKSTVDKIASLVLKCLFIIPAVLIIIALGTGEALDFTWFPGWLFLGGILLAIVIGIHNVPEGLAMALSLVGSRMKISKVILFTIIAGIPMGIGSFIGAYFGGAFNSLIGVFIALAAGTMMYVVLEEIFPKSRSLYCIIGFLVGTIIVYYI